LLVAHVATRGWIWSRGRRIGVNA